ncbi:hypothetical protein [Nocardioides sambongensis]|uniref:hypothetical protein n=1 Tax=Nocardioides sambongensis TaxID=2589074 RepID=UPI0015E8310A|nr:hypothetical protein [Nocardioides sambongensis]
MDQEFEAELERRLALIDDPQSEEGPLTPLPWLDLLLTAGGLLILTVALLWWSL